MINILSFQLNICLISTTARARPQNRGGGGGGGDVAPYLFAGDGGVVVAAAGDLGEALAHRDSAPHPLPRLLLVLDARP